MKVDFLVEHIEKHIPLITKALSPHTQIPVLANVLIEAKQDGLYISATDLELGIQVKIPAKITEIGAITVPGKQFVEVLSSLPKRKVSLTQEKESLVIISGENRIVFQTISREEFPNLFEEKGNIVSEFKEEDLQEIFSHIVFATSNDESRPELTGVFMFQKKEGVDFVATDGYRLSRVTRPITGMLDEGTGIIVSSRVIYEALSLKGGGQGIRMYVYKKGNQVLFEIDDVIVIGRLIEAVFPPYEKVIPTDSQTKINVGKDDLVSAVKLAAVFSRESANIVNLKIKDNMLELVTKSSGVGEGEIKVDVKKTGDDGEIAFNVKYVQDLLRNITSKDLNMQINGPLEPALFTTGDSSFIHIIMPVRTQD